MRSDHWPGWPWWRVVNCRFGRPYEALRAKQLAPVDGIEFWAEAIEAQAPWWTLMLIAKPAEDSERRYYTRARHRQTAKLLEILCSLTAMRAELLEHLAAEKGVDVA